MANLLSSFSQGGAFRVWTDREHFGPSILPPYPVHRRIGWLDDMGVVYLQVRSNRRSLYTWVVFLFLCLCLQYSDYGTFVGKSSDSWSAWNTVNTFLTLLKDPTIIACILGILSGACGGGISFWLKRGIQKENALSLNLQAQLKGWKDFSQELQENQEKQDKRIAGLETRISDCETDRTKLWVENRRMQALLRQHNIDL